MNSKNLPGFTVQEHVSGVGADVGEDVGAGVGLDVGADVGEDVGAGVGLDVGVGVGDGVGADVGLDVGLGVGSGVVSLLQFILALQLVTPSLSPKQQARSPCSGATER